MFTGIIEGVGEVEEIRRQPGGIRLGLALGMLAEGLRPGDSLSVSGACLTASEVQGSRAGFDVVQETLEKTSFRDLRPGAKVNLERPLRLGDRLHGHLVQGHVDGVGRLAAIQAGPEGGRARVETSAELTAQMIPKGSIALDGISLTLVEVTVREFSVALVPHTVRMTALASKRPGDLVNLETDLLGKYVRQFLLRAEDSPRGGGGLTLEKLREAGFV